jgi:hypothetical protein
MLRGGVGQRQLLLLLRVTARLARINLTWRVPNGAAQMRHSQQRQQLSNRGLERKPSTQTN